MPSVNLPSGFVPPHDEERWRLTRRGKLAVCTQRIHPLGLETIISIDGDARRTEVSRDVEEARKLVARWRRNMLKAEWNPIASDGQPARDSGPWAKEKLDYLEHYLQVVTNAVRHRWGGLAYLDLMAGPGLCRTEAGAEFDGSPLISQRITPRYNRLIFVEQNRELFATLARRLGDDSRLELIAGDCNDQSVLDHALERLPPNALTIVFLDNLGYDVHWETVRRIASSCRCDFLITWMRMGFQRQWQNAKAMETHGAKFDAFFGTTEWRQIVSQGKFKTVADRLEEFYRQRLETVLEYAHTTSSPTVMRNSRNREIYHLVLASRHELAPRLFNNVAAYTPAAKSRPTTLFDE